MFSSTEKGSAQNDERLFGNSVNNTNTIFIIVISAVVLICGIVVALMYWRYQRLLSLEKQLAHELVAPKAEIKVIHVHHSAKETPIDLALSVNDAPSIAETNPDANTNEFTQPTGREMKRSKEGEASSRVLPNMEQVHHANDFNQHTPRRRRNRVDRIKRIQTSMPGENPDQPDEPPKIDNVRVLFKAKTKKQVQEEFKRKSQSVVFPAFTDKFIRKEEEQKTEEKRQKRKVTKNASVLSAISQRELELETEAEADMEQQETKLPAPPKRGSQVPMLVSFRNEQVPQQHNTFTPTFGVQPITLYHNRVTLPKRKKRKKKKRSKKLPDLPPPPPLPIASSNETDFTEPTPEPIPMVLPPRHTVPAVRAPKIVFEDTRFPSIPSDPMQELSVSVQHKRLHKHTDSVSAQFPLSRLRKSLERETPRYEESSSQNERDFSTAQEEKAEELERQITGQHGEPEGIDIEAITRDRRLSDVISPMERTPSGIQNLANALQSHYHKKLEIAIDDMGKNQNENEEDVDERTPLSPQSRTINVSRVVHVPESPRDDRPSLSQTLSRTVSRTVSHTLVNRSSLFRT